MNRSKTKGTKESKGTKTDPRPLPSLKSLRSLSKEEIGGFIPPHGGYQTLLSCHKALVVFQATVYFCGRFVGKKSRTYDQMIQAARSGKQNILEGSQASGTSKETEIKLTGVARSSQEELLEDYRDFMRERRIEEWDKEHRYARRLSRLNRTPGANYDTFKKGVEHPDPAIRDLRQCHCGTHQGNLLFARPATSPAGKRFLEGRRTSRTHDSGTTGVPFKIVNPA